ncbi:MAG: DUF6701 domain-containing protein [Steroidobacter sp.]
MGSPGRIGLNASNMQRYGRTGLRDAVGSELVNLSSSLRTEHYLSDAAGFARHTDDVCTTGEHHPPPPSTAIPQRARPAPSGVATSDSSSGTTADPSAREIDRAIVVVRPERAGADESKIEAFFVLHSSMESQHQRNLRGPQ